MTNRKTSNILVCGSLAYDRIMDFPGRFRDHILPEKIHLLNVAFTVNDLKESFGGTAGNIAYNLALLGERPKIIGVVGNDFVKYEQWLRKNKIDISSIKKVKNQPTASAYIMTDQEDNQITAFYPGPLDGFGKLTAGKLGASLLVRKEKVKLAIIAPDYVARMVKYAKIFKRWKVPYIFDPGQQITSLKAGELKSAVTGAKVLVGNDYEIQLILNRLKLKLSQLVKLVEILIITKGERGSEIYQQSKKIKIPPAKPKNTFDPTGAGDAYRAGLIKGLIKNWPLEKVGRLAGLVAVYTVEKYGTQTHRFSWKGLGGRYRENFGEKL